MSRSGYRDGLDPLDLGRWRAQVRSASRGKRGQKLFRDLLAALDAMEPKRLVTQELETPEGEYCALGVLGKAKGLCMVEIDPEDSEQVADTFDIAYQLAKEVVYMNDEFYWHRTPEERYKRMREWVASQIVEAV